MRIGSTTAKLTAVGALVSAATLGLTACSSSGSNTSASSKPAGGGSSSTASSSSVASSSSSSSAGGSGACFSGTLNAEGSSAQNNAVVQWKKDFAKQCSGATINYNPLGSGTGVTDFIKGQITFAGSDAPLSATQGATQGAAKACGGNPAWDLPMVGGPIALGINLPGVKSLKLDAPTIAKIFSGAITTWNDKAIAALNKGTKLPSTKISPFFRSDSSGTTFNFESYLAANAKSLFNKTPDTDATNDGFAGQGQDGSSGVASAVAKTQGGIGYFEYSYAVQESLVAADVVTGGNAVAVSPDAASKALSQAQIVGKNGDLTLKLNYATTAPGAYPIDLVTYEIVCSKYPNAGDAAKVKSFLSYTVGAGQGSLKQLGYAPLPANLQTKVKAAVDQIS